MLGLVDSFSHKWLGTNCAPLLADLFPYSYENEFLDKLILGVEMIFIIDGFTEI